MCKIGLNAKVENGCKDDVAYETFLNSFQTQFNKALEGAAVRKLFVTNSGTSWNLWEVFINNIEEQYRQQYTCNCCRHFIQRFGALVFIDSEGNTEPAVWLEDVPELFQDSVKAIRKLVKESPVVSEFITTDKVLGTPKTGEWSHFNIELPDDMVSRKSSLYTPQQLMSVTREDFKSLTNGLLEFSPEHIAVAVKILKSDVLTRSEKFLGIAEWLQDLHAKRDVVKSHVKKRNLTWVAVVTAPVGFCHVKSSMIGTLLEDIRDGLEFSDIKRRFDNKVDPTKYQRAQVPPSEANKNRAEKIFQELGLEDALERRFARLDEVKTIWKPKEEEKKESSTKGLFGHIETKESKNKPSLPKMDIPPIVMTWDKFNRTVLPEAESIEMGIPYSSPFFSAIVTAKHADAKPIIQWDNEDNRNPFSHYLYQGHTNPVDWNIVPGWVKVTGVCYQPSMWQEGFDHHGHAAFFLLDECRDRNYMNEYGYGNSLFPEILISELHEVRKTIEAYSQKAPIYGYDDASACGIRLQEGNEWNVLVRVTTKGQVQDYKIDRWD